MGFGEVVGLLSGGYLVLEVVFGGLNTRRERGRMVRLYGVSISMGWVLSAGYRLGVYQHRWVLCKIVNS